MERFDGFTWRDAERWPLLIPGIPARGQRYSYRMVLEPHGRPWLLAMDYPRVWSDPSALLTQDFQLVTRQPAESVRALRVESWPDAIPEAELRPGARERFTALPARRNPRSQALAESLRAQHPSEAAYLAAVLGMFREQAFVYTLQPPLLQGTHPVDDFLFRTRRGFCEHFASAFTVLARAGGLPARVVTGYQGGEVNPVSNRLVVRQSDAHAWSEVWLDERGWTRVDPTAAVAPERIELGIEHALPAGERLPGLSLRAIPGLEGLRQGWDALNSVWNEWVLGYGPERQNDFLARLGLPGRDWRSMVLVLTAGVAGIMGLLTVWLAWRGRAPRPEAALRLYRRYCRRLAKDGLERRPSEGPVDFARRVSAARPGIAPGVAEFTRLYLGLRYGETDRGELPALPGSRWVSSTPRPTPGWPGRRCWRRSPRTSSGPRGPRAYPKSRCTAGTRSGPPSPRSSRSPGWIWARTWAAR
jgi:transglutaminase-like putative cysteine protease